MCVCWCVHECICLRAQECGPSKARLPGVSMTQSCRGGPRCTSGPARSWTCRSVHTGLHSRVGGVRAQYHVRENRSFQRESPARPFPSVFSPKSPDFSLSWAIQFDNDTTSACFFSQQHVTHARVSTCPRAAVSLGRAPLCTHTHTGGL